MRKIVISASSIKDYLVCKARWRFRFEAPSEGIRTDAMIAGSIVHSMIELHWNHDIKIGMEYVENMLNKELDMKDDSKEKALVSARNFYTIYKPLVGTLTEVEKTFEIPVKGERDIVIRGKIDARSGMNFFDWKTSWSYPSQERVDNDVQFVLYYKAIKTLYGRKPAGLHYVALYKKSIVTFRYSRSAEKMLFDIIDEMIRDRKKGRLIKDGRFKYSNPCKHCQFRNYCKEQDNELVC